jgi:geranylgeranyl diphosphate/geranylgeranyl-bacteriochlorophyllide a reductase
VRIAVVGAGPAGSLFAYHAASDGGDVTVFDASHPREKPCGGGLTAKALGLLPASPADDPLPARLVEACRFESGAGEWVLVPLSRPVAIASRTELDAWLLRRAAAAGAVHVAKRVVAVEPGGRVRTTDGGEWTFDLIVGADGAGSLVRRTFLSPIPAARRAMAAGWFARGTSEMVVRFTPGLAGYLWLFPRRDHVGVGICAPLTAGPSRDLIVRLESEIARSHPALVDDENGRYAHTIPSPSSDPRSIAEIGGTNWALLGDAAALADPITGEGIYYALRSARLLAETMRAEGSPARYPARVLGDFGTELLRSARLHARFYAPGFSRRVVSYAARSTPVRDVLGDLVLGTQGYSGLKSRLLRAAPRLLLDSVRARVRGLG